MGGVPLLDQTTAPDLAFRSWEWIGATLESWRRINERARQVQASFPPDLLAEILRRDADWRTLVPAMAMMAPDRLESAHAWLTSATVCLDELTAHGSLSQALTRVAFQTNGVGMDDGGEVAELRAEVARLRSLIDSHLAVCPTALPDDAVLPPHAEGH